MQPWRQSPGDEQANRPKSAYANAIRPDRLWVSIFGKFASTPMHAPAGPAPAPRD
jgi:hypothetical protein